MSISAFDPVLERLSGSALSLAEAEALAALWSHGEDAWLREDPRFRPTPWGRWIPSDRYLINDLVVRALREGVSAVSLDAQLARIGEVFQTPTAFCAADPRLRLEGDQIRLAASELSDAPLLEQVDPLFQYVTHLPVMSLQAAAASQPAGEWGPKAEPQRVEPMGWLRVEGLSRPLSRRMFVARVRGHSMDGGRAPIPDGAFGVFEFSFHEGVAYDPGTAQPVLLVRGDFSDPETGSYAVKRWDRHAPAIRLVSAHPDKVRFPDIVVPPDAADELRVVAQFTQVLKPSDFARRPKPQRTPGRRVVAGQAGLDAQRERLSQRIDAFFSGDPDPDETEAPEARDGWHARLVCLEPEAGGLHLEVGPLAGLPPFVKRLRVVAADGRDGVLLAANARLRPVMQSVAPGGGPWRWEAIGFEDEEDLGLERLAATPCPTDAVTVFRIAAGGQGQRQAGGALSLGQAYRLLIPPALASAALGQPLAGGWRLWTVDLATEPTPPLRADLEGLGLAVHEAWPRLEWALLPPLSWQTTPRGAPYPVFGPGQEVCVQVSGVPADEDEAALLFLSGPTGVQRLELPIQPAALVSLGALPVGRWACALVPPRTDVRSATLLFEVGADASPAVDAAWDVQLTEAADGSPDLTRLEVTAPPGWPVSFGWRVQHTAPVKTVYADAAGCLDLSAVQPILAERRRRGRLADLIVDLGELGARRISCDRRPTIAEVRAALSALWTDRAPLVQRQRGAWLTLLPSWFEPVCALLGYTIAPLSPSESPEAQGGPAMWALRLDERPDDAIQRSVARVLVLSEDLEATLTHEAAHIDRACLAVNVREVILTDGIRWTTCRRGNRLRRTIWDLGEALAGDTLDGLLASLAEGLG